jgi:hypothetical protein
MDRSVTHFEQVPLETIQAIIRADRKRRLEPEAAKPSSGPLESEPQTPVPGRG